MRANAHHVAHDLVLGRRQDRPVPQNRGFAIGAVLKSARQYPGVVDSVVVVSGVIEVQVEVEVDVKLKLRLI